jgi:di/tricarboxylate transporter
MREQSNQTNCLAIDDQINFYLNFGSFISGIFIPFILMIILTFLIGYCLIKNKQRINYTKSLRKEKRLITITIVISAVFLITNLPFYIQWLVNANVYLNGTIYLIYSLANQLTYVYNSIGFFVCLLSNSVFRKQFYSIFSKENQKKIIE